MEVKLYAEDLTRYVPDFRDNRERAEDGRKFFWVDLMPLSGRDLNKATGIELRGTRGGGRDIIKRSERVVKRILSTYVPTVGGLRLETAPGEYVEPKTGKELHDLLMGGYAGFGDIIDEIYDALKDRSRAEEGDLKKLRQRSGSSEQPTTSDQPAETGGASAAPTTPATPIGTLTSSLARHSGNPETATG
jgi:hypothetical protein